MISEVMAKMFKLGGGARMSAPTSIYLLAFPLYSVFRDNKLQPVCILCSVLKYKEQLLNISLSRYVFNFYAALKIKCFYYSKNT